MDMACWNVSEYVLFLCSEANSLLSTTRAAANKKCLKELVEGARYVLVLQNSHYECVALWQVSSLVGRMHEADGVVGCVDTCLRELLHFGTWANGCAGDAKLLLLQPIHQEEEEWPCE